MTDTASARGDMGTGLAVAMVIVAALGGLLMVVGALDDLAAAGFALALIAGIVAIWAVHVYPG